MMRRTPLNRKREAPRRQSGRIEHVRVKPRAKAAPDAIEQAHIARIKAMGCILCGRPGHVHHLMRAPGKIRRRDHRWVVCLCPEHHQGDSGVHGLGSEAAFEREHDLPAGWLIAWADTQWKITTESGGCPA